MSEQNDDANTSEVAGRVGGTPGTKTLPGSAFSPTEAPLSGPLQKEPAPPRYPYPFPLHPGEGGPWWTTPPRSEEPHNRILVALLAALFVLAVTGIAVVLGHVVWGPPSLAPPSSAPGAPPNAASIAAAVDPALVDVNVIYAYQDLQGAGTGMVLSSQGEVLTNNHVIEGATSISVTDVGNGKTYKATVVGYDRTQDIAVLQLTGASGLKSVTLGDSSKVAVGEGVVAIGNAEGAGGTPSYAGGSVTAVDQTITAHDELSGASEQLSGLIETNADIVAGDSGGALADSSEKVIGMDTAGTESFQFQGSSNRGYAIPTDQATSIAVQIEAGKASSSVHIGPTAFLGVEVEVPVSGIAGAEIVGVVPNGPAALAGLVPGDTITAFDGQPVSSPDGLTDLLLGEKPGASVQVQYVDPSGLGHGANVRLASGPAQ